MDYKLLEDYLDIPHVFSLCIMALMFLYQQFMS